MIKVNLIKQSVVTTTKKEFKVVGTCVNENTGKKPVFIIPEKEFSFATRLVRIEAADYIEYKIYTIPIFNLERNLAASHSSLRLEKINFRDGKSRITLRVNKTLETEAEKEKRINWLKSRYKQLNIKEREKIITYYE